MTKSERVGVMVGDVGTGRAGGVTGSKEQILT